MREGIRSFIAEQYRKHLKDKVGTAKTILGHKTAENVAKQIRESQPVDVEGLVGGQHKPTRINKFGEIIEEEEK